MVIILSLIATIVSSIALIGVAIGLILQARQLRVDRLQTTRALQLELIKMGIESPELYVLPEGTNAAENSRIGYINMWFKYYETGYLLGTISEASVRLHTRSRFQSEFARAWWDATGRDIYKLTASTKNRQRFFAIVDSEFQNAPSTLQPTHIDGLRPQP